MNKIIFRAKQKKRRLLLARRKKLVRREPSPQSYRCYGRTIPLIDITKLPDELGFKFTYLGGHANKLSGWRTE